MGIKDKVIEVQECSPHVLATVIDFMYGISIPEDFSSDDAKSLLTMADLYHMEDLKDAVAPLLAKQLSTDDILETAKMAERFTAQKLMEMCSDFIHANIPNLDSAGVLGDLLKVSPLVAKLHIQKQQHKMDVVNKVLGVNLATSFKKRKDFKSDLEYKDYMMKNAEPNMLVLCNKDSSWKKEGYRTQMKMEEGTVGRVISSDIKGPLVRWSTSSYPAEGSFLDVDLFTPPISADWLDPSTD